MAAEDDITVEVGVAVDKKDIAAAKAAIEALTKSLDKQNTLQSKQFAAQEKLKKMENDSIKRKQSMTRTLDKLNKITNVFTTALTKLVTGPMKILTSLLKPAAVGIIAMGAAFSGAKIGIVAADLALRAWNVAVKSIPAAVAVGLGALATFSAAMREVSVAAQMPFYQAAGGTSASGLSNLYQSIIGDPQTAILGAQTITKTTNALMEAQVPLSRIRETVRGLGNFGFFAGRGDAGAGLSSIVEAITSIGKDPNTRMSSQELKTLAAAFGPMSKNIEEVGKAYVGKDFQEFIAFLSSGPDELAAFNNGLDDANNTLIGMFKSVKTLVQGALTPFGTQILNLTKDALGPFNELLVNFINSVMPSVVMFFSQMMPSIINTLSNSLVKLDGFMRSSLPGMVDGFREGVATVGGFFRSIGDFFSRIGPATRRLADGFDIIYQTIIAPAAGSALRSFLGGMLMLVGYFEANEDTLANIGQHLAHIFGPDGFVVTGVLKAASAIGTLITTVGPAAQRLGEVLRDGVFAMFDTITENRESLKSIGEGFMDFVERAGRPFVSLLLQAFEFVIGSGDDIKDIFSTAASVAEPLIAVASALLSALESLGGMKTIISFLIGAKVLSGMYALARAVGGIRGTLGGMGLPAGGGRFAVGAGAMGAVSAAALTHGAMTGDLGSSVVGSVGSGLSAGMGVIAMGGGNPAAIAAGLAVTGASLYGVYQQRQAAQRQADQSEAARRNALIGGSPMQFGSQLARHQNTQSLLAMNSYRSFLVSASRGYARGEYGSVSETDVLRNAAVRIAEAEARGVAEAQGAREQLGELGFSFYDNYGRLDAQLRDVDYSLAGEFFDQFFTDFDAGTASLLKESEATSKSLEFLSENFGLTEQAAFELASAAGLDLSSEVDDLTLALLPLQDAMAGARSAAQIFGDSFNQYVFEPLRGLEFQTEVQSLGSTIQGAIDAGMVFDKQNPLSLFIGRSLESIPREIQRQLESGAITAAEAIDLTESLFGEVLADVESESAREAIRSFQSNVITAITQGDSMVQAEADRLANVFSQVVEAVGGNAQIVIDAIGTAAADMLMGLGVPLNQLVGRDPQNPEGDTSSPKAALLQTLGTHSMIDSMIAGSRTVTSSWRDHSLGSSNSDHVTGRAIDITGDNLGAYASAVRSMGGFAELHGAGASRHLHVVPPIGDTAVAQAPMVSAPSSRGGGGGVSVSNSNSIVVNPSPGMNEQALAQSVVREISRLNRESMERM